tara:strand:- start:414 stop:1028 length:615 start_codon:yes stop_codon:yes gene_type:complete
MKRFKPNIFKNLVFIFVILISIFSFNLFLDKLSDNSINYNKEKINIGGSFKLIDQNNKQFSSKEINRLKLIYFGYTFCPDVCPIDIMRLANLLESKPNIRKNIQPIFITVDPDRDNHHVIKNFLSNFDVNIIGLTGNENEIKKVIESFKIYSKKITNDGLKDSYLIDHTSLFYLMNKDDEYITHFSTKNFEQDITNFLKSYTSF